MTIIYEKNCELVKVLKIPHKKEFDKEDWVWSGGRDSWDGKSVNIQLCQSSRYNKIDLHKRVDILMIYIIAYRIDLINSGEKPLARVPLKDGSTIDIYAESLGELLVDALIAYGKDQQLERAQMLKQEVYLEVF